MSSPLHVSHVSIRLIVQTSHILQTPKRSRLRAQSFWEALKDSQPEISPNQHSKAQVLESQVASPLGCKHPKDSHLEGSTIKKCRTSSGLLGATELHSNLVAVQDSVLNIREQCISWFEALKRYALAPGALGKGSCWQNSHWPGDMVCMSNP